MRNFTVQRFFCVFFFRLWQLHDAFEQNYKVDVKEKKLHCAHAPDFIRFVLTERHKWEPGHKWDPPQLTHLFLFTRGCFKMLYLLLKKHGGHFRPGAPHSTGSRSLLPLLEWYGFRDRGSSTVCTFSPAFYLFINHFVFRLSASVLWKCPILLTLCMFGNDASHYHLIFWGSWNCAFSKQFWAESPDVTVLSEIECINLILQYIYIFLFFSPFTREINGCRNIYVDSLWGFMCIWDCKQSR